MFWKFCFPLIKSMILLMKMGFKVNKEKLFETFSEIFLFTKMSFTTQRICLSNYLVFAYST